MKQEQILEAAIKRFSHFGIQKTNLGEIADDLGLSKPALFYYFSDKQSLIAAVEERIMSQYMDTVAQGFEDAPTVADALVQLIEIRAGFFEKYFMLASHLEGTEASGMRHTLAQVKQKFRDQEMLQLARLFERGIASGELKPMNPEKTAGLLLDIVSGLAHCVREKSIPPNHQEVADVCNKQKDVLRLLYNGLKQ